MEEDAIQRFVRKHYKLYFFFIALSGILLGILQNALMKAKGAGFWIGIPFLYSSLLVIVELSQGKEENY